MRSADMLVHAPNQTVKTYPYSVSRLKTDNPNVSFPTDLNDALLAQHDVFSVRPVDPPAFDPAVEITETHPVLTNGVWTQTWVTRACSAEEFAARTERQAAAIRANRTQRLAESDWTQLADAPVDSAAWAAYRQALRDVPDQPGFPWTVDWPVKP